ncbi:MAG: cytochrome c [Rhodospirillales bacterium]|nr:cytochrome c [Rhodospirillales bacterium]
MPLLKRLVPACCVAGAVAASVALVLWIAATPRVLTAADLPVHEADPGHGRLVYHAAGCNACHATPDARGDDKQILAGGHRLESPYGVFVAPNISPDPVDGIGDWTALEFVNAVMYGVAPDGSHYYPAFPYLSYQHMTIGDVLDLKAYMDTLPAVTGRAADNELPLPLRLRRGIGLWKLLYMGKALPALPAGADAEVIRGAYLVNGPGHCGACHTPRTPFGGLDGNLAFSGAPDPAGEGTVPNITPSDDGIGDWSVSDIEAALRTGLLPDWDTFGGTMIAVQENMAQLPEEDRLAIAAYLLSLPPKPNSWAVE